MFYLAVVITDSKWENLLHVILTSDDNWDPDVADQYALFIAISAGETHEPQVNIEVHTTCHLNTCLVQDEIDLILRVNRHQTTLSNS